MKTIITGGAGFIGSNAASRYLQRGQRVVVIDNLCREGVQKNLDWLRSQGSLEFVRLDVRQGGKLARLFHEHRDANQVLHLAAQVAVTTSVTAPREELAITRPPAAWTSTTRSGHSRTADSMVEANDPDSKLFTSRYDAIILCRWRSYKRALIARTNRIHRQASRPALALHLLRMAAGRPKGLRKRYSPRQNRTSPDAKTAYLQGLELLYDWVSQKQRLFLELAQATA